jgi:hypothetical protein
MLWPFLVYLEPCSLLPVLLLPLLLLTGSQVLFNRLDHFVAHFRGLCEARAEVVLDLLELLAVAFCVAERDAVRPVLWL